MTLSSFAHAWYFIFALTAVVVAALYLVVNRRRHSRVLRFANMDLLASIAPKRTSRWRHLPAILVICAVLALTVAMAGPTRDIRIPRDRAVVMLVIDVSESMRATDVAPTRLLAAEAAGKKIVDELTPGINLGLIAFGGTAAVLVAPTTNRALMKAAIDNQPEDRTATGEAIFTALQAIATVGAIMGGNDQPAPARIVLESDGKETVPSNPDDPKGAFTAASTAKEQGVPISTISFGTAGGTVEIDNQTQSVPVDDEDLKHIADLSGSEAFRSSSLDQLNSVYSTLQQQIGYETVPGEASAGWLRIGVLLVALAAFAGLLINRRLAGLINTASACSRSAREPDRARRSGHSPSGTPPDRGRRAAG